MRRQSSGLRFQFEDSHESPESRVVSLESDRKSRESDEGSLGSGVESLELERGDVCRRCRGTGIRREQRMPDEAIADMGTFCLCEAGRGKWGECVRMLEG